MGLVGWWAGTGGWRRAGMGLGVVDCYGGRVLNWYGRGGGGLVWGWLIGMGVGCWYGTGWGWWTGTGLGLWTGTGVG